MLTHRSVALAACLTLGAFGRGSAQGWEYGQIVTNSGGTVIAWIAPDSQHVFCPPESVADKIKAIEVINCELYDRLLTIALMDIALNKHPSSESRARAAKYDSTRSLPRYSIQEMLNTLGREGWEVTGPPEPRGSGNRLYTVKRVRPK